MAILNPNSSTAWWYTSTLPLNYDTRLCSHVRYTRKRGFTLVRRAGHWSPAKMLTDLDFADDITLISEPAERDCKLLYKVGRHCRKIGLGVERKEKESYE